MGSNEHENTIDKEAMKKLRESRKPFIKAATEKMRKHKKAIKLIKDVMSNQQMTVPEIAQAVTMSTADVMWYVASLKKYGELVEAEKAGDYFKYELVAKEASEEAV